MKYCRLFFLLLLWSLFFDTHANISVSPIIVDLIGKKTSAEIAVKNFDFKHNAYVEVTPYQLTHPANPASPKVRVHNPEKEGLLVFPAKLVLLPGQTQFVRVVKVKQSLAMDKIYEVDFIPKVSTTLVNQKNASGPTLGIRVVVGYGARITLRPDVPRPTLSVKRINKQLVIKNTGNTSLSILSCTQDSSGRKRDISLPAYTVFAGQTVTQTLTVLKPVVLTASFMGKSLDALYTD